MDQKILREIQEQVSETIKQEKERRKKQYIDDYNSIKKWILSDKFIAHVKNMMYISIYRNKDCLLFDTDNMIYPNDKDRSYYITYREFVKFITPVGKYPEITDNLLDIIKSRFDDTYQVDIINRPRFDVIIKWDTKNKKD